VSIVPIATNLVATIVERHFIAPFATSFSAKIVVREMSVQSAENLSAQNVLCIVTAARKTSALCAARPIVVILAAKYSALIVNTTGKCAPTALPNLEPRQHVNAVAKSNARCSANPA
jgi:hypothetical protein